MRTFKQAKKGTFIAVGKSLKHLQQLIKGEEPLIIVQGNKGDKLGVLAATNKKVAYVSKGFFSSEIEEIPYSKITSINVSTVLLGKVKITGSGIDFEISQIDGPAAREFVQIVKEQIGLSEQKNQVPAPKSVDKYDQLEKIAKLKEMGVLTEEEFQEQKKIILGK